MSDIDWKFELNDRVIEIGTKVAGRVVQRGQDEYGLTYDVQFDRPIAGRKRHMKRGNEIKRAPKGKQR